MNALVAKQNPQKKRCSPEIVWVLPDNRELSPRTVTGGHRLTDMESVTMKMAVMSVLISRVWC
jgi:hypothetical protein